MARSVNVFETNWRWTGTNVQVPQAKVDITLQWIDDAGDPHEWTGEATFPNDLQDVPVAWVKDALERIMMAAARRKLGVDGG